MSQQKAGDAVVQALHAIKNIELAFSNLVEESRRAPPEVREMVIHALSSLLDSLKALPSDRGAP